MKSLKYLFFRLSLLLALLGGSQVSANNVQTDFTAAELDQMLAPIALYPDTVLSHILIASTYPLEVVQADRWARENPGRKAEAAVAAVEDQDWEPSVKALVAFPEVLQRMSEDLAWTQRLGDAFLDDEAQVMDSIQNLRNKAYASGSLDKLEHVRVQREKEVIIIEPAVERVVYVPVYDTRVVYGNWWWSDYPPVYWHYPSHYTYASGFYWGPRIHVGPSFYFSSFHWHRREVVYVDHHRYHSRPHFYTGRGIANYSGARHWRHNPTHRRGVAYHNDRVRQHYGSNRQSYRTTQEQRGNQSQWRRDQQQSNDARASRDQANQPRLERRTGNVERESDRVRERLANRQSEVREQRTGNNSQRATLGNSQQNRVRESEGSGARPVHRGNTTLPSPNDPRPNVNRETRQEANQGLRREANREIQRAPRQEVERATAPSNLSGTVPQQQRAQPQVETRRNLGNSQQARPQSAVRERAQGMDRTVRQPSANRAAMPSRGGSANTERSSR